MFPQLSADPSALRQRGSGNRPLNGEVPTVEDGGFSPYTQSAYTIPFSLNYEVDLFGRVRHNVCLLYTSDGHLPRGTQIVVRGQVVTMRSSFLGLGLGLIGAILLVYLLIVINFQSWLDPVSYTHLDVYKRQVHARGRQ